MNFQCFWTCTENWPIWVGQPWLQKHFFVAKFVIFEKCEKTSTQSLKWLLQILETEIIFFADPIFFKVICNGDFHFDKKQDLQWEGPRALILQGF